MDALAVFVMPTLGDLLELLAARVEVRRLGSMEALVSDSFPDMDGDVARTLPIKGFWNEAQKHAKRDASTYSELHGWACSSQAEFWYLLLCWSGVITSGFHRLRVVNAGQGLFGNVGTLLPVRRAGHHVPLRSMAWRLRRMLALGCRPRR